MTGTLVEGAGVSHYVMLADLFGLPFEAVVRIFGETSQNPDLADVGSALVIGATAAWTLLASAVVWLRYRALEVTR